ncbi:MAG: YtxH domain-containing protein [Thermodesulfobacteriota bacterium]
MAADDCVKGLIIGGLIGAALGILYAPKSGKETREEISHSAEELLKENKGAI